METTYFIVIISIILIIFLILRGNCQSKQCNNDNFARIKIDRQSPHTGWPNPYVPRNSCS